MAIAFRQLAVEVLAPKEAKAAEKDHGDEQKSPDSLRVKALSRALGSKPLASPIWGPTRARAHSPAEQLGKDNTKTLLMLPKMERALARLK